MTPVLTCRLSLAFEHLTVANKEPSTTLVLDAQPLQQLTKLQDLTFSLGHLYPSPAALSVLTSLTCLDLHLPGLPVVGELEYDTSIEDEDYIRAVNAHSSLFSLTGLESLSLDGSCVRSLEGIQALSRLEHLCIGSSTRVKKIRPLRALQRLRELYLTCPGVRSLRHLRFLKLLRVVELHEDKHGAKCPRRICKLATFPGLTDSDDTSGDSEVSAAW